MKIVSIVGARPQFIKLAPLSKKLREFHNELIIHTGQHYDFNMSEKLFRDLNIPDPDINLGIGSAPHGRQTGRMIIELEKTILENEPDCVIVFGDTNSTIAGALVASKIGISTVHIEAGLRSFNREMPEEINRVLTDHCSDLLFAPTDAAMENLAKEGLDSKSKLTGDIMVDALQQNIEIARSKSEILSELNLEPSSYYVLTLHRPYNVDNPRKLSAILDVLSNLDQKIVFPAHPRTKKLLDNINISFNSKIEIIEPLGYLDFINLQNSALKIITDSGGIQKEAYILEKPCITLRPETEWIETVEEGWNLLINPNTELENASQKIIEFEPDNNRSDIFGSNVSNKMVNFIDNLF